MENEIKVKIYKVLYKEKNNNELNYCYIIGKTFDDAITNFYNMDKILVSITELE